MKKLFILISLIITGLLQAQDYHFSQFYANKMVLNPALTGRFSEDYRISLIHRNQWRGIDASFASTAIGGELNFRDGFLKDDILGVGVYVYNDQLGEKTIVNNSAYLSAAYHHYIDHSRRHKISIGLQGGYTAKSLNQSNLTFGNQYNNYQYNSSIAHNEKLDNLNIGYIDVHAGLAYTFLISDKLKVGTGIAFYDLTTPKETTIDSLNNSLKSRYVWHAGASYKLNNSITLLPKLLYVNQAKAHDLNLGLNLAYDFHSKNPLIAYVGAWGRPSDALIGLVGLKIRNIDIKFSHDFTMSKLKNVDGATGISRSGRPSAYELSINILGVLSRGTTSEYTIPCGIF